MRISPHGRTLVPIPREGTHRHPSRFATARANALSRRAVGTGAWLAVALCGGALSAAPPPPTGLEVKDRPDDIGDGLIVSWDAPAADATSVASFTVYGKPAGDGGEFTKLAESAADATRVAIGELSPAGEPFLVRVVAVGADGAASEPAEAGPVTPAANWFNLSRGWLALLLGLVCAVVLGYIAAARRGMKLWVRPIAGLEAVTDAVGRAVEMGKNVLFVPGIQDINDIQTVAGITVLSRVARIAAEYDAEIKVPTARSLVMATARETVQASFLQAGRSDAYNADEIYYLTDEQFGYVAGVTGQMVRERPAACFYMGSFYAESLILAETGNAIGSIQVAGTAQPSQLPFFIVACDYTLIGEEFFAASAYLSGEPQQLGSLKGQDFGKLLCGGLTLVGCLLATIVGLSLWSGSPNDGIGSTFRYLSEHVLGERGFLQRKAE